MACILLWSSAVRVHDSQAYRKMNVTIVSRILELIEILLSFQTCFNLLSCIVRLKSVLLNLLCVLIFFQNDASQLFQIFILLILPSLSDSERKTFFIYGNSHCLSAALQMPDFWKICIGPLFWFVFSVKVLLVLWLGGFCFAHLGIADLVDLCFVCS